MPTNRLKRTRKKTDIPDLDQSLDDFLYSGVARADSSAYELYSNFLFDDIHDQVKALWMKYRDELKTKWHREGRSKSWAEEEFK